MKNVWNQTAIANCLAYAQDTNNDFVCVKCADTFFINDNKCVTACPSTKTLYRKWLKVNTDNSISIIGYNRCSTKIANCDEALPINDSTTLPTIQYTCSKCTSGSQKVFNNNTDLTGMSFTTHTETGDVVNTNDIRVFECHPTPTNLISTDVDAANNNWQKHCSLYFIMPSLEQACLRCDMGYYGTSTGFFVANCLTYKTNPADGCLDCLPSYLKVNDYLC